MKTALFAGAVVLVLVVLAPAPVPGVFGGGAASAADAEPQWQTKMEEKMSKPVDVEFQETTLSKALDYFRKAGGLNIVMDSKANDLAEKRLSLRLKKVRVESGIAWTARLMGMDYAVRDEAVFLSKPDDMPVDWRGEMQERYRRMVASGQEPWMADIEARLDRTIKVNFQGDQLPDVMQYLATQGDLNIVLDYHMAAADKPIKLQLEATVKSILGWVCKQADIRYVIRDEVIYVADQEAMNVLHLETGESTLSILFRRAVTFHFDKTPIKDALDRLSRYSNVTIDLQGLNADDALPVTVAGEQVELNRAVRMVMGETGRPFAISYRGKTIVIIVSPKAKTVPEPAAPKKPAG